MDAPSKKQPPPHTHTRTKKFHKITILLLDKWRHVSSSVRALASQAWWVCGNILWSASSGKGFCISVVAAAWLLQSCSTDMLFILGTAYLHLRVLRLHMGEVCWKHTRHMCGIFLRKYFVFWSEDEYKWISFWKQHSVLSVMILWGLKGTEQSPYKSSWDASRKNHWTKMYLYRISALVLLKCNFCFGQQQIDQEVHIASVQNRKRLFSSHETLTTL